MHFGILLGKLSALSERDLITPLIDWLIDWLHQIQNTSKISFVLSGSQPIVCPFTRIISWTILMKGQILGYGLETSEYDYVKENMYL